MIKFLCAVFVCMGLYGLSTEHKGAGLLALCMAGFTVYAEKQLRKRDVEFYTDPRSAKVIPDPLEVLHEQGSEGTRSTF